MCQERTPEFQVLRREIQNVFFFFPASALLLLHFSSLHCLFIAHPLCCAQVVKEQVFQACWSFNPMNTFHYFTCNRDNCVHGVSINRKLQGDQFDIREVRTLLGLQAALNGISMANTRSCTSLAVFHLVVGDHRRQWIILCFMFEESFQNVTYNVRCRPTIYSAQSLFSDLPQRYQAGFNSARDHKHQSS